MHRKKLFRTWVGIASLVLTNQLAAVCCAQQANQPTQQLRPQVRPNSPAVTTRIQPGPTNISREDRAYGGWTASDPQRPRASWNVGSLPGTNLLSPEAKGDFSANPVVRASFYQQFSDLPNLSGVGLSGVGAGNQPPPSLPADNLATALNDLRPVTPQPNYDAGVDLSYNSTAAFNQDMQNGPPNLGGGAGGYPLGGYGASGGGLSGAVGANSGYDAPRFDAQPIQPQGQVLPSRIPANLATYQNGQNYNGQNFNGQSSVVPNPNAGGTNLRNATPQGVYPDGQPMVGQPMLGQPAMNGLRSMNGVPANGMPIASGLPYVTPPQGQRYPTSPYMGPKNLPIQYTSYQRNVSYQQPTAGPVLPQNTQPPVYNPNNPGVYPTNYQCADGTSAYVPPTYTPNWNPSMYSANNNGYRPLFSLGQENYNVQLGRGLYGQPTVYVPGQPIRNFFRYIFP